MRRGACLLALLGMTVQNAVGDDAVRPSPVRPATNHKASQYFAAGQNTAGNAAPQKFVRTPEAAQSEGELRNYYKELFGNSQPGTPASPAAPTASASAVTGNAVKAATATVSPEKSGEVVHAEFIQDPAGAQGTIQPVLAERFSARPFPGAAQPAAGAGTTSLTQPISVQAAAAARTEPVRTASAPPTRAGGVTLTRSAPSVAARSTAQTATMEAMSSMEAATPSVTLEWRKQSDVNVGQECRCHLVVKNSGQTTARDVEVRAFFPTSVRLVGAQPRPVQSESFLGWQLPELKAGEEAIIEVTMVPLQRGGITTKADVRFSGTATGSFAVAEPMLEIQLEGPGQVLLGEPASQTVTVTNPGTGIANHVIIEAAIPEGLENARGQRLLMDLGNLNPGESRSVRLALAAVKGGRHQLAVQTRADAGLLKTASVEVNVIAPSLTAQIHGPGLRYLGRQGSYTLSVANNGAAPTDNVQVRYKLPAGFDFVSCDRGAQFDQATGLLTWFVGRLEKGQQAEMKATLTAREIGEFKHLVRATSEHGALSDAEFTTLVEGTPSLAMQVKDLEDPVEVGSETVYEVRIKNEGSAAAKSVGLSCELPAGMKFVSAEAPSEHRAENGTVVFRSLPELAAGQTALFKVKVSAAAPGSLRFRAHLSSDSVAEPLTAEELTKFYGE